MARLYAGVDGGGTRTRAVVTGADLVPMGRGASGPANASTTPLARVVEAILEAVDDALAAAGSSPEDLAALSCGIAGVEGSGSTERLVAELSAEYPGTKIVVSTDARVALEGAFDGVSKTGIVLVAGTGAVALGRNAAGDEARAGGWGPLFGDEGSAYSIAVKGLAAVVRDLDGRGEPTRIRALLFASEPERSFRELVSRLYQGVASPADVAAYFPLVAKAARQEDAVARQILGDAGQELALAALAVARRLSLEGETFPVATVGGVFTAGELVLATLRERLLREAPGARLGPPAFPPEIGAIRLVLQKENPS